jgi:hypothetical protein
MVDERLLTGSDTESTEKKVKENLHVCKGGCHPSFV